MHGHVYIMLPCKKHYSAKLHDKAVIEKPKGQIIKIDQNTTALFENVTDADADGSDTENVAGFCR